MALRKTLILRRLVKGGLEGRMAPRQLHPVPVGRLKTAFRALLAAAVVLLAVSARADPPPNADPALAPWFRSLMQPGTGISCCSISDCRTTDYRVESDHYEALVGETWFPVPPDRILQRTDNPTGRAVVCWTPQRGIVCFVRATES
jgi:hypothetical protein